MQSNLPEVELSWHVGRPDGWHYFELILIITIHHAALRALQHVGWLAWNVAQPKMINGDKIESCSLVFAVPPPDSLILAEKSCHKDTSKAPHPLRLIRNTPWQDALL